MALTIYGSPRSRTMRNLWMAAELGLDYVHIPYAWDEPKLKEPTFRALNPAGTIPTIVDDGVVLSESLAINLYLAKKHGARLTPPLYPATAEGEAQAWRWTLWVQGHLEPWVQRDALMLDLREAIGRHADETVAKALTTLDRALADRAWLIADHFTVADMNVACVLSPSRAAHLDLKPHPHVDRWLQACYSRAAAVATRAKFSG